MYCCIEQYIHISLSISPTYYQPGFCSKPDFLISSVAIGSKCISDRIAGIYTILLNTCSNPRFTISRKTCSPENYRRTICFFIKSIMATAYSCRFLVASKGIIRCNAQSLNFCCYWLSCTCGNIWCKLVIVDVLDGA